MSTARYIHTATLLPDGTVLVAGGGIGSARSSAELYHPDTKTWETVASMSARRYLHTATLLPDGTVLVAGALESSSAELYHPDTRTWETVASMSSARYDHTATLLPDGTVLVAGGGTETATSAAPSCRCHEEGT
ncbi:hypothetical protein KDW36_29790 [Burkholderia dolosa]|uniref:Kelch repeat-containing protein n=1 Tax=Burkholderia dolosa TaxID=152500 RepID=UPI001B93C5F4|nr:kelch repeat-containing protein [Burkholderia dolosa]MBR8317348.1 hypothetical protein [Burkholderia dolosa]